MRHPVHTQSMKYSSATHLGVVTSIGFSVHFLMTTAVIIVNTNHIPTNLHQKFFKDKHIGIIHIPSKVHNCKLQKYQFNVKTLYNIGI